MCAAIDRQHPRDIFDIKLLLENEGFTNEVWQGFLIALISHHKPTGELLSPVLKDQKQAFGNQFAGMSLIEFTYADYEKTRAELVNMIIKTLSTDEKKFLFSFETGNPHWDLFPYKQIKNLPAVKWKLLNIRKLFKNNKIKHRIIVKHLSELFEV